MHLSKQIGKGFVAFADAFRPCTFNVELLGLHITCLIKTVKLSIGLTWETSYDFVQCHGFRDNGAFLEVEIEQFRWGSTSSESSMSRDYKPRPPLCQLGALSTHLPDAPASFHCFFYLRSICQLYWKILDHQVATKSTNHLVMFSRRLATKLFILSKGFSSPAALPTPPVLVVRALSALMAEEVPVAEFPRPLMYTRFPGLVDGAACVILLTMSTNA